MRGKITKNRGISLLLVILIMVIELEIPARFAGAATSYVKIDAFIKQLVQAINIEVSTSADASYINVAIDVGIVKEGDFTDYTTYITRTDATVLLERADEYLHGDEVDKKLLEVILEKRISDINKIAKSKREAVAKIYAKGIIKGYGNGYYIQNREFRGSKYLTKASATNFIDLVVNPKNRAKVSPDGQLIRTTNLPKNASSYEYILESFPNKFYEKKFGFMLSKQFRDGTKNKDYYAYPVEMRTETFKTWYDEWAFSTEMDKYLNDWTKLAETYLQYIFNVDYRTVDDEWIEGLASVYAKSNRDREQDIKTYYIDQMKANKVVVESSIISVEPSTLYDDNDYCMRAYVRYRITATDINVKQNKLLYSQYPFLEDLKSGEWRDGIFDIRFATNNGSTGDGSSFALDTMTNFVDSYDVPVE